MACKVSQSSKNPRGARRRTTRGLEETNQTDRRGLFPFRTENIEVEVGACEECQHDGAGARKKK
jgi:hypothetical protein